MPTSNLWLAPTVLWWVQQTAARRVLDFGPGHGKYGVLLKEYAGVSVVDAVEMWEPYVDAFNLKGIYDGVFIGNGLTLPDETLAYYDCVLMGDVIEHLHKPEALAFIDRFPGWVVICTPIEWMQQTHEVPTEVHVSLWTVHDFPAGWVETWTVERGGLLVRIKPKALRG
jgi:SAM-dependent methyltransferase